jgi:tetratricopeptide (TPR) repeat protein
MSNDIHYQKIATLISQGDFLAALALCDQLLDEGDKNALLITEKSWCLAHVGERERAKKLIAVLQPHIFASEHILNRLCRFYKYLFEYDEVVRICQLYLQRFPHHERTIRNLAFSLFSLGKFREAEQYYRQSLSIRYSPNTAYNLGLTLLSLGEYTEGLALYEQRIATYQQHYPFYSASFPFPEWKGESLMDKKVVVWCEQGLGDTIQYSRFITLLAQQGATVDVVLSRERQTLQALLSTVEGVHAVYSSKSDAIKIPLDYDYHCALMSLLQRFYQDPNQVLASVPYIESPTPHDTKWQGILGGEVPKKRLKVGLLWNTEVVKEGEKETLYVDRLKNQKSIDISELESLASLSDIDIFSLKMSLTEREKIFLDQHNIIDMSPHISDFSDTAAIVHYLDVVVSIDTSVVHLAGAMGKPTINLLPYNSDWRWQQDREGSPWYPTMQLYRQAVRGDWSAVVGRLASTLCKLAATFKETGGVNFSSKTSETLKTP